MTFAAGLACEGLKPVVAIYSTFLQRAYDQLIHDVAIQNLPVVFALDRAGLVGADGATHAGAYDIALPALHPEHEHRLPGRRGRVPAAADHAPTRRTIRWRCAIRAAPAPASRRELTLDALPFGKGEVRREGKRIAILAFGTLLYPALKAAEALDATVVNMRWAKPLDVELLLQVAGTHDAIVTIEEGAVMGGAGSAVLEALQAAGVDKPVLQLGLPDRFIEHGDPAQAAGRHRARCGGHRAVDHAALRRSAIPQGKPPRRAV